MTKFSKSLARRKADWGLPGNLPAHFAQPHSGEGISKYPGSAGSEAKPPVPPNLSSPPVLSPVSLPPLPPAEVAQTPLWFSEPTLVVEGKSSQEAPTCRAEGAHSADRKEDIGVAVQHLQRSPALHLGEAGVPVQWPVMKEYSYVKGQRAPEGSGHHKHPLGLPLAPSWELTMTGLGIAGDAD